MENEIYKAPEAELETANFDSDNVELASRGSRLAASIIDSLTVLPISILLMYFTGGFQGISEGQQPGIQYTVILTLVSSAIFLVIHGKIMLRDGQTWGKRLLKIKIVTTDGGHADLKALSKRYGLYWGLSIVPGVGHLLGIINILFVFSKSKKCLHDHVGGTKVIKLADKSSPLGTA